MKKLLFILSLFLVFSCETGPSDQEKMEALIEENYKRICWRNGEIYKSKEEREAWQKQVLAEYDYEKAEQDHIEFLKRKRIVDSCLKNNLPIPPGRTILAEFIYNPKYDKK